MRHVLLRSLAILVLLLVACLYPLDVPIGTYRFDPPAVYRTAWQEVEQCSGLNGNFQRVRWFAVPQTTFRCGEGNCSGFWIEPHDIYLSERARSDSGGRYFTVRHEIFHDVIGHSGHPPVFVTCGLLRT